MLSMYSNTHLRCISFVTALVLSNILTRQPDLRFPDLRSKNMMSIVTKPDHECVPRFGVSFVFVRCFEAFEWLSVISPQKSVIICPPSTPTLFVGAFFTRPLTSQKLGVNAPGMSVLRLFPSLWRKTIFPLEQQVQSSRERGSHIKTGSDIVTSQRHSTMQLGDDRKRSSINRMWNTRDWAAPSWEGRNCKKRSSTVMWKNTQKRSRKWFEVVCRIIGVKCKNTFHVKRYELGLSWEQFSWSLSPDSVISNEKTLRYSTWATQTWSFSLFNGKCIEFLIVGSLMCSRAYILEARSERFDTEYFESKDFNMLDENQIWTDSHHLLLGNRFAQRNPKKRNYCSFNAEFWSQNNNFTTI